MDRVSDVSDAFAWVPLLDQHHQLQAQHQQLAGSTGLRPNKTVCLYLAGSLGTDLRPIVAVFENSYQYQAVQGNYCVRHCGN